MPSHIGDAHRLTLSISYDHALGKWWANLENGARFLIEPQHVSGKLENCLKLFSRQVIAMNSGAYIRVPKADGTFEYQYDSSQVRRFGRTGRPIAPELTLELSDLDLEI